MANKNVYFAYTKNQFPHLQTYNENSPKIAFTYGK